MAVGAAIALNADAVDVGKQNQRTLPNDAVEASLGKLRAGDEVSGAENAKPLCGDLTNDADTEARSGEGLASDNHFREAELPANGADLVLEQKAEGFNEGELYIIGKTTDVMVALNVRSTSASTGLNDVRVQGALNEEIDGRTRRD